MTGSDYETFKETFPDSGVIVSGYCHRTLFPHLAIFKENLEDNVKDWIKHVLLETPAWVASVHLPFEGISYPDIVIKRFGQRSLLPKSIQGCLNSKATRSFLIARKLEQAGIDTARPLLSIDIRQGRKIKRCYFITRLIPNAHSIRPILTSQTSDSAQVETLLKRLAQTVRTLHDTGILHRDLSLGNFFITPSEKDKLYLLDLSRSFQLPALPILLRLIDLARLNLRSHWPQFYRHYCKDRPEWIRYEGLLNQLVRFRRASIQFRKFIKR